MKYYCDACEWVGESILIAPHPFDDKDTVTGCPNCLSVDSVQPACSFDGCGKRSNCGTPTESGYKWFCHEHGAPYFQSATASKECMK